MNVDVAVIPETKKKLKGSTELGKYIMIYEGVSQEKRAAAGIAILIRRNWKNRIHSYEYFNERIIKVRLRTARNYITIIGVYNPGEGKLDECIEFYEHLQNQINKVNPNDYLIIAGDLNARVGNKPIKNVIGKHGEITQNKNGRLLIDFANFNNLKITNSFSLHRNIRKYTWIARGKKA